MHSIKRSQSLCVIGLAAVGFALPVQAADDAKLIAKGKALFLPLRRALTGVDAGPELGPWLALIGEDCARERLEAAAATPAADPL